MPHVPASVSTIAELEAVTVSLADNIRPFTAGTLRHRGSSGLRPAAPTPTTGGWPLSRVMDGKR
ncbi:hypothetical protein NITHO_1450003 [Nitrolancea hollandica Lb]|uniref:Uncharacterized protein n=1 Tax=Nitrolancea hollandica Lb TaxID=1129897 RepID=I4EDC0_9BACT|nr:hypothetical protein NITHO_1450003 [Nitrolancea hollandica Lb]